jgi:hypothetical protein
MSFRARSTYDVYCNGSSCENDLLDVDDPTQAALDAGWTVWTYSDESEAHFCPDHPPPGMIITPPKETL